MTTNLGTILNSSYAYNTTNYKYLNGFTRDEYLSNENQQTYFNPTTKELNVVVAGTHNINDWLTDANLAIGNLKNTKRYRESDKVYKQAKAKYNPTTTKIFGHSLGGAIASTIASKSDSAITYNAAYTIGQKTRSNTTAYRTKGDLVSLLGSRTNRMKNLKNNNQKLFFKKPTTLNLIKDILNAHKTTNLTNDNIQTD